MTEPTRPPLWWSPTHGLITVTVPEYEDAPVYWHIVNNRVSLRHQGSANELPADAVELVPAAPKFDARFKAEEKARNEFSMIWENSPKRQSDHDRALKHVVGVLLFGDADVPEPGALQEWAVEHPEVLVSAHRSLASVHFTLSKLPGGVLVTRIRESDKDEWPKWVKADPKSGIPFCVCAEPKFHHDGVSAMVDGRLCVGCRGREGTEAANAAREKVRQSGGFF